MRQRKRVAIRRGPRPLPRRIQHQDPYHRRRQGNPIEFILIGGHGADVTQAEPPIVGYDADAFVADKAHDSDMVVTTARSQGVEAVISSKKNRKITHEYNKQLYLERKKVDWLINLIKQYRFAAR